MKILVRIILVSMLSIFFGYTLHAQDNPVAAYSTNQPIHCLGDAVQFMDASYDPNAHTIISWYWDFDDGNTSIQQNPMHVYADTGHYNVTLIVNNDVGGADTTSQQIIVSEVELSVLYAMDVTCFGSCDGVAAVSATGGTLPYQYLWSISSDTSSFNGNLCPGVHTVNVTDANGCQASVNIVINETLPFTGYIDTSTCLDSSGFGWAKAVLSGGTPSYSYLWNDPAVQTTQTANSLLPGNYTVTVTDANGCTLSLNCNLSNTTCDINVYGYIYNDENHDCNFDIGEGAGGILVYTTPGPYYSYTNSDGYYQLNLDVGTYTIQTVNPAYFETTCPVAGFQTITITNMNDTVPDIDLGIEATDSCHQLNVNIASGNFRPCFQSSIIVHYENMGNIEALNAYIELDLDSNLVYNSSSIPYSSVSGNTYTFDLDTVDVFETGSFQVYVNVTCDIGLIGQTECVTAEIFPHDLCIAPDSTWDHSSVMVEGACIGDSTACFNIINTGDFGNGDMEGPNEYRIYANDTLVFTGSFQLVGEDTLEICWPTNGRAIRLEADQHPMHPGNSHPQETIEDCGDISGTSLGFITTTAYDDYDNFIDTYCRILTGSYDPNDKIVFPEGITDNHYIEDDVVLNYQINFQNTGNDTAFTVVIVDTLSQFHDIATLENGVSSHPSTFTVYGEGILEWRFDDILLPDSNTNEPASHGFVTFTVERIPMTAGDYGTIISNDAAIYFDFNPPVITNTTELVYWHLPIIITHQANNIENKSDIKIYPNPASNDLNIESNVIITKLTILDITGKIRLIENIDSDKYLINASDLPAGLYFIHITDISGTVSISKFIKN